MIGKRDDTRSKPKDLASLLEPSPQKRGGLHRKRMSEQITKTSSFR